LHFLIQLEIDRLGFTLAAIFELTREVFLPDQSARIVRAARNVGKSYFTKALWKPVEGCGCCAKKSPSRAGISRRPYSATPSGWHLDRAPFPPHFSVEMFPAK
jgi:hypothetical protein